MPIGLIFYILMLLWLIFGFAWNSNELKAGNWGFFGGNLLLFILLLCLGWRVFGPPIQ